MEIQLEKDQRPSERKLLNLLIFPVLLWNSNIIFFLEKCKLQHFTFYADQGLSVLTPSLSFNWHPTLKLIHVKVWSANMEKFFSFYVQFSFVRYSVYILFTVIIHAWPEKFVRHELCAPCITSDQQRVSSYLQSVFDSANIPGILSTTKNSQTQLN